MPQLLASVGGGRRKMAIVSDRTGGRGLQILDQTVVIQNDEIDDY